MTTDAKIGLLLALVFIVAITFVINGLPDFLNKKDKNDVTATYIGQANRPEEPGIVDRTSREAAAVLNKKTIVSAPSPSPVIAEANNTSTTQTTNFQPLLPAASEVVKSSSPTITTPLASQQTTASAAQTSSLTAVSTTTPAVTKAEPAAPALKTGEKIYEVANGDSLVTIAQKAYGQKAGNKYANVEKIYQANKGTMKSKNELHVGQKLVIPALSQKEKALVGSGLFEKTTDTAKATATADSKKAADTKSTADTKQAADAKTGTDTKTSADTKTSSDTKTAQADKKAPETKQAQQPAPKETKLREYVVRENDTLWKIAARTLGDGNRFKEIADLNRNINPDNLVVGTKIKLPAK